MSAGFTSGPWEIREQFIGPRLAPDSSIQVKVVRVNDTVDDPETIANTHLIAAAPALYEALEAVLTHNHSFTDDRAHWVREQERGNGFAETVLRAIDALKQARGEA